MKKSSVLTKPFFLILLLLAAVSSAWAEEYKFVGSRSIEKDAQLNASLISLGGTIKIEGKLRGSVMQIGGKLIVSGHVSADIIAFGTDIELKDNSEIDGDCLLVGGALIRSQTARIKGEYFYVKLGTKEVESTVFPLIFGRETITVIKLVKILLWLLLGLMVYAMLPARLHAMSLLLDRGSVLKHGLTGLITVTVSVLLLIIFILLSLLIIGIPLLMILLMSGAALLLVGRTVMMYTLGAILSRKMDRSNPIMSICLGALLYGILKFIPIIGFFILLAVDIVGIGIVMGYLLMMRKKV